jgi:predicted phosphodiesterase
MTMALIGDVHGRMKKYIGIAQKYEYSIQVGDLGFDYSELSVLDSGCHKFFQGNHDNRDIAAPPHCLGKYGGFELNDEEFFFISGGWSLDGDVRRITYAQKTHPKTWWQDEELTWKELDDALTLYADTKPQIMLSHECPLSLVHKLTSPEITKVFGYDHGVIETKTNIWLQKCFDIWQPKLWVFGHYHKHWVEEINGTFFTCLKELEVLEIE